MGHPWDTVALGHHGVGHPWATGEWDTTACDTHGPPSGWQRHSPRSPVELTDLQGAARGPQHHEVLGEAHGCHLPVQRDGGQQLPVHRVQVQRQPLLQGAHGQRGAGDSREGTTGTLGHTLEHEGCPTVVWATSCPSGPTARWDGTGGGQLSPGGRRERMKSPRRTVWVMMVPSCRREGDMGDRAGGTAHPRATPGPPRQLTLEPDTAMSSSVLMATHVTSASWPYSTCTGLGAKPLEKPPWRWGHGDISDLLAAPTTTGSPRSSSPHLLQDLPHHAGGVPRAGNEVDAAEVQGQAGDNICDSQRDTVRSRSPPATLGPPRSVGWHHGVVLDGELLPIPTQDGFWGAPGCTPALRVEPRTW